MSILSSLAAKYCGLTWNVILRGAPFWLVHPSGWKFQTFNFSSLKVFNCRVCLICVGLFSSNFTIVWQLERFDWLLRSQERLFDARNANKGTANRDHCFCKWFWIVERFLDFCIYTLVLPMSVDDDCTWFLIQNSRVERVETKLPRWAGSEAHHSECSSLRVQ